MIKLIAPERYDQFRDALAEMHRLRARVFKGRLDWVGELQGDQVQSPDDALGRGVQVGSLSPPLVLDLRDAVAGELVRTIFDHAASLSSR